MEECLWFIVIMLLAVQRTDFRGVKNPQELEYVLLRISWSVCCTSGGGSRIGEVAAGAAAPRARERGPGARAVPVKGAEGVRRIGSRGSYAA